MQIDKSLSEVIQTLCHYNLHNILTEENELSTFILPKNRSFESIKNHSRK
jgi:hypothetical protein